MLNIDVECKNRGATCQSGKDFSMIKELLISKDQGVTVEQREVWQIWYKLSKASQDPTIQRGYLSTRKTHYSTTEAKEQQQQQRQLALT